MLGIIGGSGFYTLEGRINNAKVKTPYGTVGIQKTKIMGKESVFIPRHGKNHSLPPHKVNYRANIYAFKKLGVSAVMATYATGIISRYKPGDIALIDDFIGFYTPSTFFDDFKGGIKHADVSQPYDRKLRDLLLAVAKTEKIKIKKGGIVATTTGPRFETRAEVKALKKMGANMVSMTNAYEASLLNEIGMPSVAIAVGTNYACGISKKPISQEEVMKCMKKAEGRLARLANGMIKEVY